MTVQDCASKNWIWVGIRITEPLDDHEHPFPRPSSPGKQQTALLRFNSTHLANWVPSSVFKRVGAGLREPCEADRDTFCWPFWLPLLLLLPACGGDGGRVVELPTLLVGVKGTSGFAVMLDRALSVLEPINELKREPPSFLVMVTGGRRAEQRCRLLGDHSHST